MLRQPKAASDPDSSRSILYSLLSLLLKKLVATSCLESSQKTLPVRVSLLLDNHNGLLRSRPPLAGLTHPSHSHPIRQLGQEEKKNKKKATTYSLSDFNSVLLWIHAEIYTSAIIKFLNACQGLDSVGRKHK